MLVGIDPHKKSHTAVMVDESGHRTGKALTVKNSPDAVGKLTAWADTLAGGQPVRFVIEDGRGLASHFATALVLAGSVVSWLPVRLMKAERRLLGERGKSDPIDALATALAALNPDNAKFLAPHSADEVGRNVGYLVDQRRDRVNARTRLINTLRWRAHFYDPHLVPGSLITLAGPGKLAAALAERPAGELRDVLIRDCEDLERLTGQINTLTRQIQTRITEIAPTLLARPGVGPISAATILAELGDPTRLRGAAAFARIAGTAPIPVWSSNQTQFRLDRGGNRRINHAIHCIALSQTRMHPPAQKLTDKHCQKGNKHAMRVLKRHLTNAIWRDLMIDLAA